MMGFLFMLFLLCFSRNVRKDNFILDKFLTMKNFDFHTKKSNIGIRLVGHIDLWSKNDKSKTTIF